MSTSRRSKEDIDRFVKRLGEDEKHTRGYQVAVLYSEIGEYEAAKRSLTVYLSKASSRENLPRAHKLMGQICEGLKEEDQAIECYKKSLELDSKQKNLVLKICELLTRLPSQDVNRLQYWTERGQKESPNSPIIFKLQEKILFFGDSSGSSDRLEDLYAKQLEKNYLDVNLHIKLLDLYINTERVAEAVYHAMEVERTLAFVDSLEWYKCLSRIFKMYRMKEQGSEDFHLHCLFALRNLVFLQIPNSDIITSSSSLYQFDQCLLEAVKIPSQRPKWRSIITEMEGQLYFLLALLLLKRAQKGQTCWKDSSSFATVCLLISNHLTSIDNSSPWFRQIDQTYQKFFKRLVQIGSYRQSQGGYMLTAMMRSDTTSRLQYVKQQLRTPRARDMLYDLVFMLREMKENKDRSYLMKSDHFQKAPLVPPSKTAVFEFDGDVYSLYGENLHELVWMALHQYSTRDKTQPVYGFMFGEKLPYSAPNLANGAPESLCQLDVQAFFYAVVRCAAINYEEQNKSQRQDPFKPVFLPACICAQLCSQQQCEWWEAMYKFMMSGAKDNFSKMRRTIQRGLETVRVTGAHGMSVGLITHLANTFDARALEKRPDGEEFEHLSEALERRAACYWREATRLLARLEKNLPWRYPKERLFIDGSQSELENHEIKELTEQANFSLAVLSMREGRYEEAVEKFQTSKKPIASFHLAKIYRDMADSVSSDDPDAVNQKTALLEKTLDTLYDVMDKIQDDKNDELNKLVPATVEDVVNRLERIRTAGMSLVDSISVSQLEDEEDSFDSTASFGTPQGQNIHDNSIGRTHSVEPVSLFGTSPRDAPSFSMSKIMEQSTPAPKRLSTEMHTYTRPSPERLDARIWALEKKLQTVLDLQQGTKDQTHSMITNLNSQMENLQGTVKDHSDSGTTKQKDLANEIYELKQTVREIQGQHSELVKDMKEMKECMLTLRGATAGRYMMQPMATPFRPPTYGYPPQQQPWIPGANYGYQVPPMPGAAYPGAMGSLPRMTPHSQPGSMEHLSHQNDIVEDDIYHIDGEYYEDDGSQPPPNLFNVTDAQLHQDWPFGHRAGLEGKSTITYSPQGQGQTAAPQTGFFAQALRGQALQYAYKQNSSQGGIIPRGQSPQLLPQQQAQGLPGPGFFSSLQALQGQENLQVGQVSPLTPGSSPAIMEALAKSASGQGAVTMTTVSMPPNAVAGPSMQSRPNLVQVPQPVQGSSAASTVPFSIPQSMTSQPFDKATTTLASGANMPLFGSLVAAAKSPDKGSVDTEINVTIHPVSSDSANVENFGGLTYTIDSIKTTPKSGSATSLAEKTESSAGSSTFKFQTASQSSTTVKSPAKFGFTMGSPVKPAGKDDHDDVEEYEPNIDFKPVVELPDLVEIKTGEEEEDKLFGERAKLFRYDQESKQWKDRGIGELKILKNKITKRTRILMRRDQVLKLCANHFLAAGMKLSIMSGSDRAWCWTAQDFSEEELQTEKLAIKFKHPDQAAQFKEVFEEEVAKLDKSDNKEENVSPTSPEQKEKPKLSELFKAAPGSWTCSMCLISNDSSKDQCVACSTAKPGSISATTSSTAPSNSGFTFGSSTGGGFKFGVQPTVPPKTEKKSEPIVVEKGDDSKPNLSEMFKPKAGDWSCAVCLVTNPVSEVKCMACTTPKPGAEDTKTATVSSTGGFVFGSAPSSGFQFGATATPATTKAAEIKPGGFQFGQTPGLFNVPQTESNGTGGFVFNKDSAVKPSSSSAVTEASDRGTSEFKFGSMSIAGEKPSFVFGTSTMSPVIGSITSSTKPCSTATVATTKPSFTATTATTKPSFTATTATTKPSSTATVATTKPSSTATTATTKPSSPATTATTKPSSTTPITFTKPSSTATTATTKPSSTTTTAITKPSSSTPVTFKPSSSMTTATTKPSSITTTATTKPNSNTAADSTKPSSTTPIIFTKPSSTTTSTKPSSTTTAAPIFSTTMSNTKPTFTFGASTGGVFGMSNTEKDNKQTQQTADTTKPSSSFTFSLTPDKKPEGSSAADFKFNFDQKLTATPGEKKTTSPVKFSFTPTASSSMPVVQSPKSPETDADGMYLNKEGEDAHLHFEPVIKLPDNVEIITGEEDDDLLFEHRAKLYRWQDKQWKERGLGNVKILRHSETGKCRVLMRRDQVLKICCHHYITENTSLQPMPNSQGKALVWFAMDFSEGDELVGEQFSIRFKTAEIADKFKEKFEEAKTSSLSIGKLTPGGAEGGKETPKISSDSSSSVQHKQTDLKDDSEDVIFVKWEKATPEQVELARRYLLPDHFYLSRPPCPGCRGCENDSVSSPTTAASATSPVTSKVTPKIQPTSLFGSGSSVIKPVGGVFGSADKSSNSGGLFASLVSQPTDEGAGGDKSKSDPAGGATGGFASTGGGLFGNTNPNFSFASLAANAGGSTNAFQKDSNKPFSWSGAGQQLFGTGDKENEQGDEDDVVPGNDPHFEPVIPLPALVEVVTGEEGQTVLFGVRAKLYRFDPQGKQWKEKGIGEMKILKNPESGKVRLLMRREQVLKLACNHWLTPDIKFTPMATSDTAWCWTAQDFSDEEPKSEQFAVNFKNTDLAAQFKEIIDTCQAEIQKNKPSREDKVPIQVSEVSSNVSVSASGDASSSGKVDEVAPSQTEDDDDDDDYEDVEEEVLFEKRLTLSVREGEKWKSLGTGQLKIILDDDVGGNKVIMETDSNQIVCSHIIVRESAIQANKKCKYCEWSPLDFSTDEPVRRDFRATFSSDAAVEEFVKAFEQGRILAAESDISERDMVTTFPREIDIPEVHSHNAAED